MKQTVNFSTFQMAFEAIRPDNFDYEGLSILFDYLEQYERDTGEEMELDVIGICCEWEQADHIGIAESYALEDKINGFAEMSFEERCEAIEEWLNDQTLVAGTTSDGMVVFCIAF